MSIHNPLNGLMISDKKYQMRYWVMTMREVVGSWLGTICFANYRSFNVFHHAANKIETIPKL